MQLRIIRLAFLSGVCALPIQAAAQSVGAGASIVVEPQLDRSDVAGGRAEPGFEPRPIAVGPLQAFPQISVIGGYTTNVFNRSPADGDALLTVIPSLLLKADLPRHDFSMTAAGALRRLAQNSAENSEEFDLQARGRLDFAEDRAALVSLAYAHLVEPRSTAATVANAAEPASYNRLEGRLGTQLGFGRISVIPAATYQRIDYDAISLSGGGQARQSFRDARVWRGDLRIEYQFSGLVSAFASGSYSDINSTSAPATQKRDAHNISVMGGIRGDLSPVLSGEIGVGYQAREYALPAFRDFSGLTFNADLQWYVTPLVTLRGQVTREFRNSGDIRVAGILADTATFSAFYDPLRNLRLSLSAELGRDDYRETDTWAWRKSFRAKAQYRLNRQFSIGGYAGLQRQDVGGTPLVSEFTAFVAGVGVTVAS